MTINLLEISMKISVYAHIMHGGETIRIDMKRRNYVNAIL